MKRNALGHAARCWNREHIDISVVLRRESYLRAVGRKLWIGFLAAARGKPFGLSSLARNAPKIIRVNKDDRALAQSWLFEQFSGPGGTSEQGGSEGKTVHGRSISQRETRNEKRETNYRTIMFAAPDVTFPTVIVIGYVPGDNDIGTMALT